MGACGYKGRNVIEGRVEGVNGCMGELGIVQCVRGKDMCERMCEI